MRNNEIERDIPIKHNEKTKEKKELLITSLSSKWRVNVFFFTTFDYIECFVCDFMELNNTQLGVFHHIRTYNSRIIRGNCSCDNETKNWLNYWFIRWRRHRVFPIWFSEFEWLIWGILRQSYHRFSIIRVLINTCGAQAQWPMVVVQCDVYSLLKFRTSNFSAKNW